MQSKMKPVLGLPEQLRLPKQAEEFQQRQWTAETGRRFTHGSELQCHGHRFLLH